MIRFDNDSSDSAAHDPLHGAPQRSSFAGFDGAIRMLLQGVREIVAEEVRAQIAQRNGFATDANGSTEQVVDYGVPPPVEVASAPHAVVSERRPLDPNAPRAPSDPDQPNFDAAEAAWFLRYPTVKAFYHAVRRYAIPHARKGERAMIFKRADLEKFLASRSRFR